MPADNASRRRLTAAQRDCCMLPSWAKQVRSVRHRLGNMPDILVWCGSHRDNAPTLDKNERKDILQTYRHQVVLPAIAEYDKVALEASAHSEWPITCWCASSDLPRELLSACWEKEHWQKYRVWMLARVTGRRPLPLFGMELFPFKLGQCPACNWQDAGVEHVLCFCPTTRGLRESFLHSERCWDISLAHLFGDGEIANSCGDPAVRFSFVANCFVEMAAIMQEAGDNINAAALEHGLLDCLQPASS